MAVQHQLISSFLGSYKYPTQLGQELLQSTDEQIAYRISKIYRKLFETQSFLENLIEKNGSVIDSFALVQQHLYDTIINWKQQQQIFEVVSLQTAQNYFSKEKILEETSHPDFESPSSYDTQFMQLFTNHINSGTTRSAPHVSNENLLSPKDILALASTSENLKAYFSGDAPFLKKTNDINSEKRYNNPDLKQSYKIVDETPLSQYYTPSNEERLPKTNEEIHTQFRNNTPINSKNNSDDSLQEKAIYNLLLQTSKALMNNPDASDHNCEQDVENRLALEKTTSFTNLKTLAYPETINKQFRASIESVETQASSWAPYNDIHENIINIQAIQDEVMQLKSQLSEKVISEETVSACFKLFGLNPDTFYSDLQITSSSYSFITTVWINFWMYLKLYCKQKDCKDTGSTVEYLDILEQFDNLPIIYETVKQARDTCIKHIQETFCNIFESIESLQLSNFEKSDSCITSIFRQLALNDLDFLFKKPEALSSEEYKSIRHKVLDSFLTAIRS